MRRWEATERSSIPSSSLSSKRAEKRLWRE
jgi:hypothetical protein